jgi:hypothetical protein
MDYRLVAKKTPAEKKVGYAKRGERGA